MGGSESYSSENYCSANLVVHQSPVGYVGKLDINLDLNGQGQYQGTSEDIGTIIIIDRSGSMGNSFAYLLNKILPQTFQILGYSERARIDIITFESSAEHFYCSHPLLCSKKACSRGGTAMTPAIQLVPQVINQNSYKNYRLLVISDGDLEDQYEAVNAGAELLKFVQNGNYKINFKAVRFYTNSSQPDTRGMASLLQLNTYYQPKMIDINAKGQVDVIAHQIAALFMDDGMDCQVKLVSGNSAIQEEPWSNAKKELMLEKGENLVWLKSISDMQLQFPNGNKQNLKVKEEENMTYQNYKEILGPKLDMYQQKMKVLKVVNTPSAVNEMDKMINFFNQFESGLEMSNKNLIQEFKSNTTLKARVVFIKKIIERRMDSVSALMTQVKYDSNIGSLNSKEQAEYIRGQKSHHYHSNEQKVNLQFQGEIDFDEIVRGEMIHMASHINKIKDIDDSKHSISFYSTCTTLEGLKTVVQLTKDPLFNSFSASDILKLINITGVAARGPIGEFADPQSYHIESIFPGTTISLSDVLVASQVSGGDSLKAIGTKEEFNTVVPYFDDERIHLFLLEYAPKTLEYLASLGMRRMLADVPKSWEHSLLSGVLKMVQILLFNRSEVAVKTMEAIKRSYEVASGKKFSFIKELISPPALNQGKAKGEEQKQNRFEKISEPQGHGPTERMLLNFISECLGMCDQDLTNAEKQYKELDRKANGIEDKTQMFLKHFKEETEKKNAELKKELNKLKEENKKYAHLAEEMNQLKEDNKRNSKLTEEYMTLSNKYTKLMEEYNILSLQFAQPIIESKDQLIAKA